MNVCSVPAVAPVIEAATMIVTDTEAEADLVESACEIAVTVTVDGCGIAEGAVYRPEFEIVPMLVLPPLLWFTCHVTAWFVLLATVAANCTVAPTLTVAEVGETEMPTGGGGALGLPPPQPEVTHAATMIAVSTETAFMFPPSVFGRLRLTEADCPLVVPGSEYLSQRVLRPVVGVALRGGK
jgi:hypothetical protein